MVYQVNSTEKRSLLSVFSALRGVDFDVILPNETSRQFVKYMIHSFVFTFVCDFSAVCNVYRDFKHIFQVEISELEAKVRSFELSFKHQEIGNKL